jgi:hypothetical protein
VVLHPDRPRVLMLDEAGVMALPGVELAGEVGTADAAVTAAALRELLGLDALLLCSLEGHDDPEARVQRATLVADAPLFANEGVVMATLVELFPDRVPAPLAVDAERRWTALADFGEELDPDDEDGWEVPVEVREDVLRTFARLQVQAVPHVDRLLGAGCLDRRPARLAAQAAAWLPAVDEDGRLPGIDPATWLSAEETAALGAAVPTLTARCRELAASPIPPLDRARRPAPGQCRRWRPRPPVLRLDRRLRRPPVRRPADHVPGENREVDAPLRDRLLDAYLSVWTGFEPAERLLRAWRLFEPLGALHHAISDRSLAATLRGPIDRHMAASTAYWLRRVLAGLRPVG